jgi:ABC-type transporter Mla subunit MlaD
MTYDPNRPANTGATERELDRTANRAHDTIDSTTSKAHQAVDNVADKAQQVAGNVQDKAQQAVDKAQDIGQQAMDKAQDIGQQAVDRADAATTTVGEKMTDAAQTIRQKAPMSGPVATAADTAANTLERAGTYLQEQDLADMRGDLEGMIRRYPVQSLLIGFGIGYLLARGTRR